MTGAGFAAHRALASWHPGSQWAGLVHGARQKIDADAGWEETLQGWNELAMMLGDTHATELCLWVTFNASQLLPEGATNRRVHAHMNLCLWDLGLAHANVPEGATGADAVVPIAKLGERGAFRVHNTGLAVWLEQELRPFGGNLDKATAFALRLAEIRTGLVVGPGEPTLLQVLDDTLWAPSR